MDNVTPLMMRPFNFGISIISLCASYKYQEHFHDLVFVIDVLDSFGFKSTETLKIIIIKKYMDSNKNIDEIEGLGL